MTEKDGNNNHNKNRNNNCKPKATHLKDMEEIKRKCQSTNFSKLLDYIVNEFYVPTIQGEDLPTSISGCRYHH